MNNDCWISLKLQDRFEVFLREPAQKPLPDLDNLRKTILKRNQFLADLELDLFLLAIN